MEKADKSSAKMNSIDLNNADAIREKTNSLNAQKNKNLLMVHNQKCRGKDKNFCNDELKKHVSLLCKYEPPKIEHRKIGNWRVLCSLTIKDNNIRQSVVIMRKM